MAQVFSDQARMDMWLAVERAALAAIVADGTAPLTAFEALEAVDAVDVAAVKEREAEIHHDLAAFVDVVGVQAPGAAGWLHYGLTSSDVVDTALALQMKHAGGLILAGLHGAQTVVARRAHEHRDTAMLGRTHGMPAEPITFGGKLVGWWHQLRRDEQRVETALRDMAVGKLSGAVGMYTGLSPAVEARVLDALGLARDPSATQIVQRDRHAAVLCALATCAASLERFCTELRHLQRSEVGEAAEPFGRTQKGSSAMPHKRNPIVSERVCGLARVVRSHALVGLENVALWHERDISHSSAERVVIPDAFLALDYMLERFTWLMDGLVVNEERMRRNLAEQRGLVQSQQVLLALVADGMLRDDAYRAVQRAAAAVIEGQQPHLAAALAAESDVAERLGADLPTLAAADAVRGDLAAVFAGLPAPG